MLSVYPPTAIMLSIITLVPRISQKIRHDGGNRIMSLMQMSSTSTPSNQCVQKNPKYELVAFSSESSETNEDIVVISNDIFNDGPLK